LRYDVKCSRALIVDEGGTWSTLGAVRSLARAGWTVAIGSPGGRGLSASSRHVSSRHDVPPLSCGLDSFSAAVCKAVAESRADVVFGGGDAEVYALCIARDQIPAIVPYPPEPVVLRAFDKLELCISAGAHGLAAPWTAAAGDEVDIDGPLWVKSRWHWDPRSGNRPTRLEASIETGRAAINARVKELRNHGAEPVLQEPVNGEQLSLVVLRARDGRTLGTVFQQVDRRWPTPTGWTVRAHTIPVDAELARGVESLLDELGWSGLVELEFIRPPDGIPRLVDFNGRYYGSMALAIGAGVDFPALWAADATGQAVEPSPPARVPARFQRLAGDLRRAVNDRHGGLWRDVAQTIAYSPRAFHSTLSASDPRPAGVYLRHSVQEWARGRADG
jgi:predicted ATP-grasp superfamily ATP-dependent carboligase